MVASSRMCRRFVRRRDKVTLAMQDLRSLGEFWLRPLTGGGSCVKLAQEENPILRQKKGGKRGSLFTNGYILNISACSPADRCEGALPSLKMARYQPKAGRVRMQYGLFTMPSHPPERGLFEGHCWDLQTLRWADELGFSEAWIGEHHPAPWEPHPSPDLLIAQALMETRQIRLAPGGFLLPYHHPAELANRVAMLDHMAQGRLNFGVAASGLPSDWAMFNVDGNSGQHREMTREALDIILKLWTAEEPFDYSGKYWKVTKTDLMLRTLRPHIRPLQKPYPPIGVAGVSKGSDTLKLAGEHGFLPMSP